MYWPLDFIGNWIACRCHFRWHRILASHLILVSSECMSCPKLLIIDSGDLSYGPVCEYMISGHVLHLITLWALFTRRSVFILPCTLLLIGCIYGGPNRKYAFLLLLGTHSFMFSGCESSGVTRVVFTQLIVPLLWPIMSAACKYEGSLTS
jgi:hypothetical protein